MADKTNTAAILKAMSLSMYWILVFLAVHGDVFADDKQNLSRGPGGKCCSIPLSLKAFSVGMERKKNFFPFLLKVSQRSKSNFLHEGT